MSLLVEPRVEPPAARIRRMEKSLVCFGCGLLSLVPVVGIPAAVVALWAFRASRLTAAGAWNPAAGYRGWGLSFAVLGLGLHLLAMIAMSLVLAGQLH